MSSDLNDIVRRRNARLIKKPSRIRTTKAAREAFREALSVAPQYVIDAVTRAAAIGRAGR